MIFKPDAIDLIRGRRKSQTRRPADVITAEPFKVVPCRYHVGRLYQAQPGRGKTGVLELTVFDVRLARLGDISPEDVRKEGFRFRKDFEDRWHELHGSFDASLFVWVISFAVGDLRDRFDVPRLLKATPGRTGFDRDIEEHQDYTSRPHLGAQGEPEAISAKDSERYSTFARARDSERLSEPLRLQRDAIAKALGEMRLEVSSSGTVRDSVRRMEAELQVLNRKLAA